MFTNRETNKMDSAMKIPPGSPSHCISLYICQDSWHEPTYYTHHIECHAGRHAPGGHKQHKDSEPVQDSGQCPLPKIANSSTKNST